MGCKINLAGSWLVPTSYHTENMKEVALGTDIHTTTSQPFRNAQRDATSLWLSYVPIIYSEHAHKQHHADNSVCNIHCLCFSLIEEIN